MNLLSLLWLLVTILTVNCLGLQPETSSDHITTWTFGSDGQWSTINPYGLHSPYGTDSLPTTHTSPYIEVTDVPLTFLKTHRLDSEQPRANVLQSLVSTFKSSLVYQYIILLPLGRVDALGGRLSKKYRRPQSTRGRAIGSSQPEIIEYWFPFRWLTTDFCTGNVVDPRTWSTLQRESCEALWAHTTRVSYHDIERMSPGVTPTTITTAAGVIPDPAVPVPVRQFTSIDELHDAYESGDDDIFNTLDHLPLNLTVVGLLKSSLPGVASTVLIQTTVWWFTFTTMLYTSAPMLLVSLVILETALIVGWNIEHSAYIIDDVVQAVPGVASRAVDMLSTCVSQLYNTVVDLVYALFRSHAMHFLVHAIMAMFLGLGLSIALYLRVAAEQVPPLCNAVHKLIGYLGATPAAILLARRSARSRDAAQAKYWRDAHAGMQVKSERYDQLQRAWCWSDERIDAYIYLCRQVRRPCGPHDPRFHLNPMGARTLAEMKRWNEEEAEFVERNTVPIGAVAEPEPWDAECEDTAAASDTRNDEEDEALRPYAPPPTEQLEGKDLKTFDKNDSWDQDVAASLGLSQEEQDYLHGLDLEALPTRQVNFA